MLISKFLKNKFTRLVIILLILVCLEFFLFSFKGLTLDKSESLLDYQALKKDSISIKATDKYTYKFDFPSKKIFNIEILSLSTKGTSFTEPIDIKIIGKDSKLSEYNFYLKSGYLTPGKDNATKETLQLDLEIPEGSILYLEMTNIKSDVTITSVKVNSTDNLYGVNPVRLIIFLLIGIIIWACSAFRLNNEIFNIKNKKHLTVAIITLVICLGATLLFCALFTFGFNILDYPIEDLKNASPYVQQLDAFLKGQLHLDIEVPKELLELENPYDYSLRENIDCLWDRAMYDGNYYSYFGIAPIICVYLPFYLITGGIAGDGIVVTFYTVLTALFSILFLYAFVIIYKKRVSVSFISLSTVAFLICNGAFFMTKGATPFYHIAVLSAMATLMMFLFFILLAINCRHRIARPILLALSSLAYALTFLSRVNIAIVGAIIVLPILYFAILKGRNALDKDREILINRSIKEKIIDFSCLGGFVLAAVIFTFIYNYLRFDSIFEFGSSYQLTVSDITKNDFSPYYLIQYMYHALFQPFRVNGMFPFFTVEELSLNDYGGFMYTDPNFGLFAIPLMLGVFLSVYIFKSKDKTLFAKMLCASIVIGALFVSLLNFELGGVIFRYTCDITLTGSLLSILSMMSLNEGLEGSKGHTTVLAIEKMLMIASIFVCFNVFFSYLYSFARYDAQIFGIIYNLFQ